MSLARVCENTLIVLEKWQSKYYVVFVCTMFFIFAEDNGGEEGDQWRALSLE